ncbi:reverse transcriptase domain-containing protein, partial [Tanacetum coccineum]
EPSTSWSNIDEENLDLDERNVKQCKRKISNGHYTTVVRVLSSSGVAPYNDATLEDLKAKHPFKHASSLPHIPIDHHQLIASPTVVLEMIKSFPRGTSCGRDGLRAQHLMDCLSDAVVAISDELVASITQVVNLFLDGKCPRCWRRLVFKVSTVMIDHSLDGCLNDLQFGVGVSEGGEAILHDVNRLIEDRGDDVGLFMLLVDFKNAFNLVDREVMLQKVRLRCPTISRWVEFGYSNPARLYYGEDTLWSYQGVQQGDSLGPLLFALVLHPLVCKIRDSFNLSFHAWYLDDGTIIGDTLVVGKILELIMKDGPHCSLHLNIDKTEIFWPKEDPRSKLAGVFPPNIGRPGYDVKLLGGPVSVNFDYSSELVMKRVAKKIKLMDDVANINEHQSQHSFDAALRSALERIVTASGPGFDDWQLRLVTLPFAFGGLGVYSAGDVLNYAFLASRLQSASLQTKLLRHSGIVASGPAFEDALCGFNLKMEIDLLSNPTKIAAPKLMKKLADIYISRVLLKHLDLLFPYLLEKWLYGSLKWRTILLNGLRWFQSLACSRVFVGDIYGYHDMSCAGIVGIKHRHNIVRDTLVDICFRSWISAGEEVEIGLSDGRDKTLRPADMLLYSWDRGLDVCVDLTGSSPLTQTGMADFVPGRVVIDAAKRKRVKYEAKCANIGYGFLPFSFSSFGELEEEAINLLKQI